MVFRGEVPAHVHDCAPEDGCRFLGTMTPPVGYAPVGTPTLDLWVHDYADRPGARSLLYRWSDDGPDYESLPYGPDGAGVSPEILRAHPVFAELLRRAADADASTVPPSPTVRAENPR